MNPDALGNVQVSELTIPEEGLEVHLKKYGFIRLFHSLTVKVLVGIGLQILFR